LTLPLPLPLPLLLQSMHATKAGSLQPPGPLLAPGLLQVINPASGRLLKQLVSRGDSRPGQEVTALVFTNLGTPHRTVLATGWDRKVSGALLLPGWAHAGIAACAATPGKTAVQPCADSRSLEAVHKSTPLLAIAR
jgi:hypothetical protein